MSKKVTRMGMFETNSSSTHSIVLGGGENSDGIKELLKKLHEQNGNNLIFSEIDGAETGFGRGEHRYKDPPSIVNYTFLIVRLHMDREHVVKAFFAVLKDVLNIDIEVDMDSFNKLDGEVDNGYIDHQSDFYDYLETYDSSYEFFNNVLFNNSVLFTDDDSDGIAENATYIG